MATLLLYSCLENPMYRGAWRTTVHGVPKSLTQLSDQRFHFHKKVAGKRVFSLKVVAFRSGWVSRQRHFNNATGEVVKNLPARTGDTRDPSSIPGNRKWPPTKHTHTHTHTLLFIYHFRVSHTFSCCCCCCLVTKSCLILCNAMDYSLPVSSVHGIFQSIILKRVVISFFRISSPPGDQTCISCTGRSILYLWAA